MREILFRGKREYNGKWVEGSLLAWTDDSTEICYPRPDISDELLKVIVRPETVGQFTGLTDRNGKRIFEGDIIKSDNGKQSAVSVVKYGDYLPRMFYRMLDMCIPVKRHLLAHGFYAISVDKAEEMILFQSPCVEVIGNVHDNPELLDVEDISPGGGSA